MAKRDSVGKPQKTSTAPKSGKTSGRARTSTSDTMVDSVAIFIGKSVGTAVKRTRGLRKGVSKVGADVVEAGSRAGQAIKEYLPEVLGGPPAKAPTKRSAKQSTKRSAKLPRKTKAGATTPKIKTPAPKSPHGQDALTQKASPARTKPATSATRGVARERRAPSGRRG